MMSIRAVTLAASTLTTIGPGVQLFHAVRARSVTGLSRSSFTMLTTSTMLALLLGLQYKIGAAIGLTFLALAFQFALLALISVSVTLVLLAVGLALLLAATLGPPIIGEVLLGTHYSEVVAFVWGVIFAITFVPQVLMTRRSRNTRPLSLVNLLISTAGAALWTLFAGLVANYSMLFWCCIMLLCLLELVRLKLSEPQSALADPT
jgi:uncharacterized protein with PQ loop repeat